MPDFDDARRQVTHTPETRVPSPHRTVRYGATIRGPSEVQPAAADRGQEQTGGGLGRILGSGIQFDPVKGFSFDAGQQRLSYKIPVMDGTLYVSEKPVSREELERRIRRSREPDAPARGLPKGAR